VVADDREQFGRQRRLRLAELPADHPVWQRARSFFDATLPLSYSYNFDWLGLPIIEYPQDLVAMQELCWRVKPDLIVETGVARGGSIIFYASMLELLRNHGRVLGVDIEIRPHNRTAIESHPLADRVTLIEGSSTDELVIEEVRRHAAEAQRILVVLDSNHTREHVRRELELYAPLVTRGSYIVVFDTVIEYMSHEDIGDRPWGPGNSPLTAVDDWLRTTSRFVVDREIDAKLLISAAPGGYLRCVED
jgi:cephalosporin hydroxylase